MLRYGVKFEDLDDCQMERLLSQVELRNLLEHGQNMILQKRRYGKGHGSSLIPMVSHSKVPPLL